MIRSNSIGGLPKISGILLTTLLACLTFSAVQAQQVNPFVGTWAPAAGEGQQVFISSLEINGDQTFVARFNDARPEMNGGWSVKDNKLALESEELKKQGEDLTATIASDGRLKLTKGTDEENSLYFIRK